MCLKTASRAIRVFGIGQMLSVNDTRTQLSYYLAIAGGGGVLAGFL
jgi:hypothetical protein